MSALNYYKFDGKVSCETSKTTLLTSTTLLVISVESLSNWFQVMFLIC